MKKVEQLLTDHTPKPRRALRSNFTQSITAELNAHPQAASSYTRLSRLRSRLLTRAGMLSLTAGTLLVGGTAMAIAIWPTPSVSKTTAQELPSGNHIVGYNAKNCGYFSDLDGSTSLAGDEKVYYEVRQDSSLTDEQLQNTLQGICEENISNNAMSAVLKQLPKNLPSAFSTLALHVDAIQKGSITVSLDPHYDPSSYVIASSLTYTQFAHNLLVYNQSSKSGYGSLHVGDTVKMVMQGTSGISSENNQGYVPENHPDQIVIAAIVKIPALTADPTAFYRAVGSDMVRLDACSTSPTGFCRAYDFANTQH